ncbi:MAG: DUF1850 domain-containing protein [Treponema sp.]|nr:DUF1850 domain-containing protein [Treponema sp.]
MKRRLRTIAVCVIAALVFSGAAVYVYRNGWLGQSGGFLVIRDADSGRVYGKRPVPDLQFAVEFVHSVHQSPVREFFQIDGGRSGSGRIQPVAVRFHAFGAGMYSELSEGQTLGRDGDALVISGFTTSLRELNYLLGAVTDHRLIINGNEESLRELCGVNTRITLRFE